MAIESNSTAMLTYIYLCRWWIMANPKQLFTRLGINMNLVYIQTWYNSALGFST